MSACNCDGAGCISCSYERAERGGGEQGLTAIEIERDAWQRRCLKAEAALLEAREDRDEAQQAASWAVRDRDAALAQLSLLSKGGAA